MKKINLFYLLLLLIPEIGNSQQCQINGATATGSNTLASSCVCPPGGGSNCDLIPDISIAKLPLNQSGNYTEYAQVCNPSCSGNDGRLRIGVSTPIIGYGPLESRGTSKYVCGTDTVDAGSVGNIPSTCPVTGLPPKQLINQRIYRKNGNSMNYWERPAGSMTYHASHGHQHVDDWGIYTLRTNNGDPNPLNWPIIGTGAKLGFCLIDLGNCTSSSGYCTDSAGNTLNNTNIANYGLGGGNYGCNNTVQGITNGFMDTYSQSLDGMWINIPPGVCNGTYWVVVQIDPYNYFLETKENNNVVAVPITLTKQSPGGTATITPNKNPNICISDNITLTANSGTSYLWSNGATTQNITVSNAGTYTVTVTSSGCGSAISSPFTVTTFGPNPPMTTGDLVCNSGSGTLTASGAGTINWFSASSGGSSLGTGTSFNTPVVNTTTNYYASATTTSGGQTLFCPPANNAIGSGAQYTGSQYLSFNVTGASTLKSVKIYANVAGSLTVQLQNSSGTVINSLAASVPAGESRVTLNFPLNIGTAYRLTRSGSFSLFRNNGGVSYPYNVTNFVSITGSSGGSAFYYFFYDWEITTPIQSCASLRTAATVTVNQSPNVTVSPSIAICNGSNTTLTAGGASTYSWSPSTGLSSTTGSSVTASPSSTTTYTVTGTANGCTGTNSVTVTVNSNPVVTVSPSTSICNGENTTLNASGAATYSWSPSTGLNTTTGSSVIASPSSTTTYTVIGTTNGCTGTNSVTVTVNPLPTVTASNVSGCTGTPIALSGTPAGGTWSVANPYIGSSTTYTHTYTNGNGCTNTSAAANITVNPLPTVSFSGLASSYNVTASSATLTGSPGGGTFSGPGISGNIFTPSAAGVGGPYTISYSYTNGNGCSNSSSQQTTVINCTTLPAKPGSITSVGGVAKMCPGDSKTYSIASVSGATSYLWTPPTGGVIATGQGTVSVTINYTGNFVVSDSLKVAAINACGAGPYRGIKITRNTPATPSTITGQNYNVCNSTAVPYSVTAVAGITYNWSFSVTGASIASGQGTNSVTANYSPSYLTGAIRVSGSNACGTSAQRTLTVKATFAAPASLTGSTTVCANQFGVPYSISPIAGAINYTWTGPSGSRISDGTVTSTTSTLVTTSASVTVNYGNTAGSLKVRANNSCGVGAYLTKAITFVCRDNGSLNSHLDLTIYPNPSEGKLDVIFHSPSANSYIIRLSDVIGKALMVRTGPSIEGENKQHFDLSKITAGIYTIEVINGNDRSIKKLVVK